MTVIMMLFVYYQKNIEKLICVFSQHAFKRDGEVRSPTD
jgi:hypothetical protein